MSTPWSSRRRADGARGRADDPGQPVTSPAPDLVRWGQSPCAFELSTHDAELAACARALFGPWPVPPGATSAASFSVEPSSDARSGQPSWEIRASTRSEPVRKQTAADALRWVEFAALEAFAPLTEQAIAIHGALVDVGGRGAIVIGPPEAGKSSLACAVWRAGGALLADDVALVDLDSAQATPGPRRIALRHSSRPLVGEELWRRILAAPSSTPTGDGWCFHPEEIDGRPRPSVTRLGAVIFLARPARPDLAPAGIASIAPAQAVLAWLPYLVANGRFDPGAAIRRVAPLAERVPAFDLARGRLDDMVDSVARVLGPER